GCTRSSTLPPGSLTLPSMPHCVPQPPGTARPLARKRHPRERHAFCGTEVEPLPPRGLGQRAVHALQRLPGLEQLGALGGEIRHLTGEGVSLGAQHVEALLELDRVVPEALQLTGQALLLGEAVGELHVLSRQVGRETLPLL